MAVPTTYFLISDVHSENKLKVYVAVANAIFIVAILSITCQNITNETSKFTENLYKCPWIYWNTENRKILLIIMVGGKKEWEITCYNIFPINNKFISQGTKMVYTFVAALANLKKK
ncbi:uncharacterized protein [Diabrotica undecimpunctata]|uniref:uncharacterized protein n=1 Tax=Diabrotica undecimpunctata TaxID=50387 RepID=UPI003B63207D